jgi:hypothetical protein
LIGSLLLKSVIPALRGNKLYRKYSERLEDQYREEIQAWKWEFIKREARENARDGDYTYEEDGYGMEYLGSILNIYPSGKYYMPFACSNLAPCDHCKGRGSFGPIRCIKCNGYGTSEAYHDEIFGEVLEEVANENGGWIQSGEGDPCDLFFCISIED